MWMQAPAAGARLQSFSIDKHSDGVAGRRGSSPRAPAQTTHLLTDTPGAQQTCLKVNL